uniref:lipoprotein signal peptidase n=1 Tax=Alloprevotella sp. TaxID=1872471 RepID=UPI003FF0D8FA
MQSHTDSSAHASIKKRSLIAVAVVLGVIIIDQLIKFDIKTTFLLHEDFCVAGDWFHILFTENRGMAFGMQFVGTMFLALFRIVAIGFFCLVLARLIKRKAPYGVIVCVAMIIAGASGNIVDNMFYGLIFTESTPFSLAQLVPMGQGYGSFMSGKVVDMFYFPLFTWPDWMPLVGGNTFFGAIFNFADAAISCGAVALLLFYYKYISQSKIFDFSNSK